MANNNGGYNSAQLFNIIRLGPHPGQRRVVHSAVTKEFAETYLALVGDTNQYLLEMGEING